MKLSSSAFTFISIASFLTLVGVQFFLVYNTYKLQNEQYYFEERKTLNDDYCRSIANDKIFPGGITILDRYLIGNMQKMERLYTTNRQGFNQFKQRLCDSIFLELRQRNNLDSLLPQILKRNNVNKDFRYSSTISQIEVAFKKNEYVPVYNNQLGYRPPVGLQQTTAGMVIGGDLQTMNAQNQITALTVSTPADYSYRLVFHLFGEPTNRNLAILKNMIPTFSLSFFSILAVIFIFYFTYKNWLKQKKLSEMKSDFINSITHEFHTPLAAIIVANKTMQNEKIISSKQSLLPLTDVITRQSQRLKTLINQVLDITTVNHLALKKQRVSLHCLLEEIVQDYRLKLAGSNVTITVKKEAVNDSLLLDPFWFTTALQNLLDNAIKYNDKKEKKITITTFNASKSLVLSISDNGSGMEKETQKQSFEKFYRHSKHLNGEVKGLGLGLFYVKQAVDAHRWKIELESQPGVGSTFIITTV